MARRHYHPEKIIAKLREADVLLAEATKVSKPYKTLGIHEMTHYRWRREYGGMKVPRSSDSRSWRRRIAACTRQFRIWPWHADFGRAGPGKLLSPERRRADVKHMRTKLGVSERRACRKLTQHRCVQRYVAQLRPDEDVLTTAIVKLASRYGRYGYRRIEAPLRQAAWPVNGKQVERIAGRG